MLKPKPIETRYAGYLFRSRLEARYAVFFDALGLRWEYEKEGYDLGEAGWYLPDFWLPDVSLRGRTTGIWIEIKPTEPTDAENTKCRALADAGAPVILFVGLPGEYPGDSGYEYSFQRWDNSMCFMRCYNHRCLHTKVEFMESTYCHCPTCGSTADRRQLDLINATIQAKAARFEHGR